MNLKRWTVIVALIAILGTVVGVGLEGTWAQTEPRIQVSGGVGDVQLLARGVGVSVPFQITCSGTDQVTYFQIFAEISQRIQRGGTVYGSSYTDFYEAGRPTVICNGEPQTVAVETIRPQTPGFFKKGAALVTGTVYLCGLVEISEDYTVTVCDSNQFGEEVNIR
jgi:hypothetical protein